MSKRADYERISTVYDNTVSPVGSDVIVAMIQLYTGKQLKDTHVLDAGCGTGNYAKDLIDYGVGHVLNHLDDEDDNEYPTCVEALKEAKRVLRKDGLIISSTVLPSTLKHAVWYTQLNTSLTERYIKRLPSLEQFEYMFQAADISCVQKMNISGSDLQKVYHCLEGPLDSSWRADQVYWLSATEGDLNVVKQKIKELKAKGKLDEWVKQHDNVNTCGLLTIFVCKPIRNI
ncbi:uncharacterized protein LOC123547059 isoform X3 [Mercenaria mercenaria]|uniref:uncharacterized protein LOC123547059 isoform X3 n=1 Tax=Mercenaria mercenaria TaxID=6596 RepID=UPI00234EBBCD|nr:uncharacterized protein LOC123547059 isoform X3 [Mercenaria mercenaria]